MSGKNLSIIDKFFLLSAFTGPATSYSIVYLFHIILTVKISKSALSIVNLRTISFPGAIRFDVYFFSIFLLWYSISILWAENTAYALRYCSYILLAVLTVFYTIRISCTLKRLRYVLLFLASMFSIEIILGILEGMEIIRLPFSKYSPYQIYFGRHPSDPRELLSSDAAAYVLSMPTGFFGNSNNLAAFLVLILPFFLLYRRWSVKLAGAGSILFIVYMAGARIALIAYAITILVSVLFYTRNATRLVTIVSLLVLSVVGGSLIDIMKDSQIPRIVEVGKIGVAIREMALDFGRDQAQSSDSVGIRVQLMLNGFEALRDSYGLGVGAGGDQAVQEESGSETLAGVSSMHNFWVELLVDGGVAFAFIFAIWYLSLLWRLWHMGQYSSVPLLKYCGRSLFVGFVGFILGAIGPSSVIYMLPMWMLVGIALAAINLEGQDRAAKHARKYPLPSSMLDFGQKPISDGASS